jgi:hypothetical protein
MSTFRAKAEKARQYWDRRDAGKIAHHGDAPTHSPIPW